MISIYDLKGVDFENDVLAGELPIHQGCLPDASDQDDWVDGECGEGNLADHGWQSLHLGRVQTGTWQLSCKTSISSQIDTKK